MKVSIACKHSYEEWSPESLKRGIGGSEQAVIHMADELANLGHTVTVYNSVEKPTVFGQVVYEPIKEMDQLQETDVLIVWRTGADVLEYKHVKREKTYLWLHDMVTEAEIIPFVYFYDKILVLSQFHRKNFPGINDDRFYVTRNGTERLDLSDVVTRNPFKLVYTSAYDRGLVKLLENWTKLKLRVPEVELHVMYGWAVLDAMHHDEAYAWFKEYMKNLFDQEGITEYGRLPQSEVIQHLRTAQLFAYPCGYPETSCIAAMQAQMCGAVPVVVPTGALIETVHVGPMAGTIDEWCDHVIRLLEDPSEVDALRELMTYDFSWSKVASEWDRDLCTMK